MISLTSSGSFARTEAALRKMQHLDISVVLEHNAREGVKALSEATPIDSGLAESSWGYEIGYANGVYFISWTNSDIESGFPVAIMLQYGYGTGRGGYVQGRDYINPAIRPVFDKISDEVWKAVTSA